MHNTQRIHKVPGLRLLDKTLGVKRPEFASIEYGPIGVPEMPQQNVMATSEESAQAFVTTDRPPELMRHGSNQHFARRFDRR